MTSSGLGRLGGSDPLTTVPFSAEASFPFKDQSVRWAPFMMALDDEVPNSPVECLLCAGAMEDCLHLFFACPLAQAVWQAAGVSRLVTTSKEATAENSVAKLSDRLFLRHFGVSGPIKIRSSSRVVPLPFMLFCLT